MGFRPGEVESDVKISIRDHLLISHWVREDQVGIGENSVEHCTNGRNVILVEGVVSNQARGYHRSDWKGEVDDVRDGSYPLIELRFGRSGGDFSTKLRHLCRNRTLKGFNLLTRLSRYPESSWTW